METSPIRFSKRKSVCGNILREGDNCRNSSPYIRHFILSKYCQHPVQDNQCPERHSHYNDKTIVRLTYLYNGDPILVTQNILYWDGPLGQIPDDVMTWERFRHYRPIMRGIHLSLMDFFMKLPIMRIFVGSLGTNGNVALLYFVVVWCRPSSAIFIRVASLTLRQSYDCYMFS